MAKPEATPAVAVGISKEDAALMIAEALKLQADAFNEAMSKNLAELEKQCRAEFPTIEQVKDLFNEAFTGMLEGDVLKPVASVSDQPAASQRPPLDPDWLEGLIFKGAKVETVREKGQRPKVVGKPFERPLTPADVLSYAIGETAVTLVAADGKKHTVEL